MVKPLPANIADLKLYEQIAATPACVRYVQSFLRTNFMSANMAFRPGETLTVLGTDGEMVRVRGLSLECAIPVAYIYDMRQLYKLPPQV